MKKRSCRRTTDENAIHGKAVKMRKMTDEQLVHYVEDRVNKARSEGYHQGKACAEKFNVNDILAEISKVNGIGEVKLNKIKVVLEKRFGGNESRTN